VELTWVTIAASLAMGLGAAFLFVFAVKRDWFRDLEETKYQVFWSDQGSGPRGPRPAAGPHPAGSSIAKREAADDSQSEKN
jgi:hypothetical protein